MAGSAHRRLGLAGLGIATGLSRTCQGDTHDSHQHQGSCAIDQFH
jgi:hypothetical protein